MPRGRKKTGDANPPHAEGSEVRQCPGVSPHTLLQEQCCPPRVSALLLLLGRVRLGGRGSRKPRAERITATVAAATQTGFPDGPLRPGAAPPRAPPRPRRAALRGHVIARAGSAHAEERSLARGDPRCTVTAESAGRIPFQAGSRGRISSGCHQGAVCL